MAADAAVGGFEAYYAAETGRLADAAAGAGAYRGQAHPGLYGDGGPAGAATGDSGYVGGVAGRAVVAIFVAATHGKFITVGAANQDGIFVQ